MCDYRNDGIVCKWRFLRTTSAVIERIGEPEEERHILTGLRYKYQRLDFFSFVMPFFDVASSLMTFSPQQLQCGHSSYTACVHMEDTRGGSE